MSRAAGLALLLAVSGANVAVCRILFPDTPPGLAEPLRCVSYDPRYRFRRLKIEELARKTEIPEEWIEADLKKISRISGCVRTYFATHGMEQVPRIAQKYSLSVILGADVSADPRRNTEEMSSVIRLARAYPNVRSVIVGNEVILHDLNQDREFVAPDELIRCLTLVRRQAGVPVSTSEIFQNWVRLPALAAQVDFLALHELPYWNREPLALAVDGTRRRYDELRRIFPGKPIQLAEVGWPSGGPSNGYSLPGRPAMAEYLRAFTGWAHAAGIDYNYCEAFDQPWKNFSREGRIGGQWGLFDANGTPKLGADAPRQPWLLIAAGLGALLSLLLAVLWKRLNWWCYLYLFVSVEALVDMLVSILQISKEQYLLRSWGLWIFVIIPSVAVFCLVLIHLKEYAEIFSYRPAACVPCGGARAAGAHAPFVSIHVPCCRESPAMLVATLQSLLALDYPRYEVVVMDNNSTDPAGFEPVARFCALHPNVLRFFHEDVLAGYKSGALNYALRRSSSDAAVVAVVDADYLVKPDWLKDLVPLFADPRVAVVQAPQSYRRWADSAFARMVRDEYEGFFRIGMVQRNEHNAIIQHGTMLLIRRTVLDSVGGWAPWCITEDTELGLRILMAGHRARYVEKIYGEGLVPDSADAYFKQRFRWVNGAMSILRRYARELLGLRPALTPAQRYHFIVGWLPWLVDASVPFFVLLGLCGASFCLVNDRYLPPNEFSYPFVFFFLFRFASTMIAYAVRVKIGWWRTFLSNIAGIALTWIIAIAVLWGLSGHPYPFYRTQKSGAERSGDGPWLWRFYYHLDALVILPLLAVGTLFLLTYGWSRDVLMWNMVFVFLTLPLFCRAALQLSSRKKAASSDAGARRATP